MALMDFPAQTHMPLAKLTRAMSAISRARNINEVTQ